MAHADALSRYVAYVDAIPLEKELEYRQLADPGIGKIIQELELLDNNDKFTLVDGLLYRKVETDLKFVVPEHYGDQW